MKPLDRYPSYPCLSRAELVDRCKRLRTFYKGRVGPNYDHLSETLRHIEGLIDRAYTSENIFIWVDTLQVLEQFESLMNDEIFSKLLCCE